MKVFSINKINLRFPASKFLPVLIFLLGVLTVHTSAQVLSLDANFNGGVTDAPASVYVSTAQPDGKVLVGGLFNLTNGSQKSYIARLNSDGTTDNSFNPGGSGPNGSVYDIVVLADGKLLVGGNFTSYNGTIKGGLVRLDSDGSIDATFNAGGAGVTGTAQTVQLQTDGKILIAGAGISAYNGIARFSVLRVNSDGSLDAGFTSPFTTSQFVEEVRVQADGKILVGGAFIIGSPSRVGVARLNSNGSIDASFNPNGGGTETEGSVYAMTLQADGKILIGGNFSYYNNNYRPKIARLNSDGSLDTTFNPGSLDGTSAEYFAVQTDGKILVAGRFIDFFNQQFSLIRLNASGSLDNTFQPIPVDNGGYHVKLQAGGKIILTGLFTQYGSENHRGIVRLNAGGGIDNSFNASFSNVGLIDAAAQQPDGKFIVGGTFRTAGGAARYNIARFNQNGTLDTTFMSSSGSELNTSDFSNTIFDIAIQPDGKILVAGSFGGLNGSNHAAIVRLNSDGSVDDSFNVTFFDSAKAPFANSIVVQTDGKILIGGFFFDSFGQSYKGLVRLNSNGSLDSSFSANSTGGANSVVRKIVRQTDGRFLIGGNFTAYNGVARNRVARINADGTLDSTFNPGTGANGTVLDIALQADNKILIGGVFTTYNGTSRNRLARLNADGSLDSTFNVGVGADNTVYKIAGQPNGQIFIGGFFANYNGAPSNRLARVNTDGSADNTFVSGFINNPIYNVREILVQPSGKVLIGGLFESYNSAARNSLLQLMPILVSISGHVTDSNGIAIEGTQITITDSQGNARTTTTSSSGEYSFDDSRVGENYVLSASDSRYRFAQPSQTVSVNEQRNEVNFMASPTKSRKRVRFF
ncbi:MAG: carboxypeptidase regulatory-like domain-containing protein [Pyrinomonadaceae bacterium]